MNQRYSPRGFSYLPPVVKNLLIINVLAFLAYIVINSKYGIDLNSLLGMHYFASEKFRVYQLVTYMFMHGGFTHLLFNMFAFWMFGYVLEQIWGSKRFLTFYFVTGVGAILIQMLVNFIQFFPIPNAMEIYAAAPSPADFTYLLDSYFNGYYNKVVVAEFVSQFQALPNDPNLKLTSVGILDELYNARLNIPTVGASGAVYGILLAFGMMFPEQRIYVYFLFPIKAKWFVVIFAALSVVMGLSDRPGDNVAHFAHLGGMIFGYFLIRHWKKNQFHR
jgi:membrane associated rhomboid family serine protease